MPAAAALRLFITMNSMHKALCRETSATTTRGRPAAAAHTYKKNTHTRF